MDKQIGTLPPLAKFGQSKKPFVFAEGTYFCIIPTTKKEAALGCPPVVICGGSDSRPKRDVVYTSYLPRGTDNLELDQFWLFDKIRFLLLLWSCHIMLPVGHPKSQGKLKRYDKMYC